jgi:hypothetical protein
MKENKNCPCCNEPMVKIGTKVKIVDNYHEHGSYTKGTTHTITGYDDYGYYILDGRYTCSELEIEII